VKKAARAKKNPKKAGGALQEEKKESLEDASAALSTKDVTPEMQRKAALKKLSGEEIAVTYKAKKGTVYANFREVNVSGFTVNFHRKPLIKSMDLVINYGNRYRFIGPNGSGKSTVICVITARFIPIPEGLSLYFFGTRIPCHPPDGYQCRLRSKR